MEPLIPELIHDSQRLGSLRRDRLKPNQERETRSIHLQLLVIEKALQAITITITITITKAARKDPRCAQGAGYLDILVDSLPKQEYEFL